MVGPTVGKATPLQRPLAESGRRFCTMFTIPCLPARSSAGYVGSVSECASMRAKEIDAARTVARYRASDARQRMVREGMLRDADAALALLPAGTPAALVEGARTEVRARVEAGMPQHAVWSVVDSAWGEARAVRYARAAAPAARAGVAVKWTAGWGERGVAAHAARVARVLKAAGTPRAEATVKSARAAIEAAEALRETRAACRAAEKSLTSRARPLTARLAEGTRALPAAARAALKAYRAKFVRAFRWPSNAAQSAPDCTAELALKGRVLQSVSRAWTDYTKRERHECVSSDVTVLVTPMLLARPEFWSVGGMMVLAFRPVGEGLFAARVARQGRGVAIEEEDGFLAASGSEAVFAPTERGARQALACRMGERRQHAA